MNRSRTFRVFSIPFIPRVDPRALVPSSVQPRSFIQSSRSKPKDAHDLTAADSSKFPFLSSLKRVLSKLLSFFYFVALPFSRVRQSPGTSKVSLSSRPSPCSLRLHPRSITASLFETGLFSGCHRLTPRARQDRLFLPISPIDRSPTSWPIVFSLLSFLFSFSESSPSSHKSQPRTRFTARLRSTQHSSHQPDEQPPTWRALSVCSRIGNSILLDPGTGIQNPDLWPAPAFSLASITS